MSRRGSSAWSDWYKRQLAGIAAAVARSVAVATARHAFRRGHGVTSGSAIEFQWDKLKLEATLGQLEKFGKKKNRVLVPAVRAGAAAVAKDIRKGIPAYAPRRRSQSVHRTPSGRRRSRLWEAKAAVGVRAGVQKRSDGDVPVGSIFGKAGSNVGKPKMTSYQRKQYRKGFKGVGIGRGNLHWYLAGTKRRYTRTGVYTGSMRRPSVVNRAEVTSRSRAQRAMLVRARKGLAKLYKASRK